MSSSLRPLTRTLTSSSTVTCLSSSSSSLVSRFPSTSSSSLCSSSSSCFVPFHRNFSVGHGPGRPSSTPEDDAKYGISMIEPEPWHKWGGKVFGALIWGWLAYRLKEDWRLLFGHQYPWDHGDDHH